MPVSECTRLASLNFSSIVVAAAGWMNLPKRVPVFAKPQDGISVRKRSSVRIRTSSKLAFIGVVGSAPSSVDLIAAAAKAISGTQLRRSRVNETVGEPTYNVLACVSQEDGGIENKTVLSVYCWSL